MIKTTTLSQCSRPRVAPMAFRAGGAAPRVPLRPRQSVQCAAETTTTDAKPASASQQPQANPNACKTCGMDLSKKPAGCDGEGRIVGGLGALPGMGWWPIKAYMPCSGLSQAGLEYVRKGQATNEMLFGGVSLGKSGASSLDAMTEQAEKGIEIK